MMARWFGSGFALSIGVCVGAWLMRRVNADRPPDYVRQRDAGTARLLEKKVVALEDIADELRAIRRHIRGEA